jgi:hypothetical protein
MALDDAELSDDEEPSDDETLDELLDIVREALSTGDPLKVLGLASATLSMILFPDPPDDIDRELVRDRVIEEVVLRYVEAGTSDSLTYAAALTGLIADDTLRTRLRAALDGADAAVPRWLAELGDARLEQTTIVRDLFDDDEWLLAGIRLADDARFAFRVEIDHDADGALADASLMPTTVDTILGQLTKAAASGEVSIVETDADDVWARYTEAVAIADLADDDVRTETWPMCRPLVEWALTKAPTDRRTAG